MVIWATSPYTRAPSRRRHSRREEAHGATRRRGDEETTSTEGGQTTDDERGAKAMSAGDRYDALMCSLTPRSDSAAMTCLRRAIAQQHPQRPRAARQLESCIASRTRVPRSYFAIAIQFF